MRALIQRVQRAQVDVGGRTIGRIGPGLLILLGIGKGDGQGEAAWIAKKCAHLRLFPDAQGKMNRSLVDTEGDALVVSQFTLYGDCTEGRRPDFMASAPPQEAEPLYHFFIEQLTKELGRVVHTGAFGAHMHVELLNDGPVTFLIEKAPL